MTRSHKAMGRSLIGGDLPTGRRHFAGNLHLGSAFQDNRVVPTVRFTIGFKAGGTYELDHHAGVFLTNAEPAKFHAHIISERQTAMTTASIFLGNAAAQRG